MCTTPIARADDAAGAERRSHAIVRATQPPQIDGVLDDACWEQALRFDTFRPIKARRDRPAPPTRAMLTYDDDALYVGFRCDESSADNVRAVITEHDGPVWQEDCVELFLDTAGDGLEYTHLAVSALGVVRDAWCEAGQKEDLGWDSGASASARQDDAGWAVEIRLPLDALPLVGEGSDWRFQLARTRSSAPQHLTMLSAPAVTYHAPRHFEALSGVGFRDRPIRVIDAALGERLPGVNRASVTLRNEGEAAAEVVVRLTGGEGGAVERTIGLEPRARATCELPWPAPAETRGRARLAVYWRGRYMGGLDQPLESHSVLGELGRSAYILEPDRPLTIHLPVSLAAASREVAELRWELSDVAGVAVARGAAAVEASRVSLVLERFEPGRYELKASLRWGEGSTASRSASLYLVESPFLP